MSQPQISIIIPTLNEADHIGALLTHLNQNAHKRERLEIVVADGGSSDDTQQIAIAHGARFILAERGRAIQMNAGAHKAQGEILYFLHADTLPPAQYDQLILNKLSYACQAGSFRMRFDHNSRFLGLFAWLTRYNFPICRGGDQSLFLTKSLFESSGGFNENYRIYEDGEFIRRLYKLTDFDLIQNPVTTSARKYEEKGLFSLQFHFGMIHAKRYLGAGPQELYAYYKNHIEPPNSRRGNL